MFNKKLSVVLCIILVIAMTFAMAACGDAKADDPKTETKDVALDTIYQTIFDACQAQTSETLPLLQETDEGFLSMMYEGLFEFGIEDSLFYQHPVTGAGCEITILKVKAEDVDNVITVCNKRIEAGSSDDFYPDNAGTWKNNSTVLNYGNYVILICMPESVTLPEAEVEALFK